VKLKHVIENSISNEVDASPICKQSEFIEAALKAAKHTKKSIRETILQDVSVMLGCEPRDLNFLFHSDVENDKGTVYKLDLPDSRLRESDIYLEAAE